MASWYNYAAPITMLPGMQGANGFLDRLGSGASDFFMGTDPTMQKLDTMTPQQMAMSQQAGQMGMSGLQNMLNQGTAGREAEIMRQYNQQILPGLAERFGGAPTAQFQNSSGFGQSMAGAGGDLMSRINALREEAELQKGNLYGNMMNMGMQPQFQYHEQPGRQGMLAPLLHGLGQGVGAAGAAYATGGASVPSSLASMMGGSTMSGAQNSGMGGGQMSSMGMQAPIRNISSNMQQFYQPSLFPQYQGGGMSQQPYMGMNQLPRMY